MNRIREYIKNGILEKWHFILSVVFTLIVWILFKKCKIHFWDAHYYNDMLTALITFVSSVISIFGILIPTVFTGNSGMINYFKKNADISYFRKSIKTVIVSGFGSIGCICFMYLYDKVPMNVFRVDCILGLFFLLVFMLGSYKYLSIMLRLLVEDKEQYTGKEYKKQSSERDRHELNDMLKKQNDQ